MAEDASLEMTPTWAVAAVCAIFITVSILLEHAIHLLSEFLKKRKKKMLNRALYQIKLDLMLLGFISLLSTVAQQPTAKICIPKTFEDSFLPCKNTTLPSGIVEESSCKEKGKISLVSAKGIDQLQMLIFSLAFFHVISCLLTMGLGEAKMKKWELWEEETKTTEYQFSNDPRRIKLTRETTFGRRHLKYWSDHSLLLWPVCFFRQFTGSISKADYFALRRGFILEHFAREESFDFHKFLGRSLDADFVEVVGIRLWIWVFSTMFIFFNAYVFHNYLWLPFIPLLIALIVGTKLEVIITRMCLESSTDMAIVSGTLLVKPHNELFWFGRPRLFLQLIHLVLFQNSFQLAFFTWTWYKFGLRSCFHKRTEDIAIRIAVGIFVQLLCGYVTLPLYALVTQMGSTLKPAVFTEDVAMRLKTWHETARQSAVTTTRPPASTSTSARPSISHTKEMMNPSPFPSPSLTMGSSSLNGTHEKGSQELDVDGSHVELGQVQEIAEEEADAENTNPAETSDDEIRPRESYDGELSFRW